MGDGVKGVEGSRAASVRLLGELSPRRKPGSSVLQAFGDDCCRPISKEIPFDRSVNTIASASHAAFGYMSNYSPQVEATVLMVK